MPCLLRATTRVLGCRATTPGNTFLVARALPCAPCPRVSRLALALALRLALALGGNAIVAGPRGRERVAAIARHASTRRERSVSTRSPGTMALLATRAIARNDLGEIPRPALGPPGARGPGTRPRPDASRKHGAERQAQSVAMTKKISWAFLGVLPYY